MSHTTPTSRNKTGSNTKTPVDLIFDGDSVEGPWMVPAMVSIVCDLCGKKETGECTEEVRLRCVNANPYCG